LNILSFVSFAKRYNFADRSTVSGLQFVANSEMKKNEKGMCSLKIRERKGREKDSAKKRKRRCIKFALTSEGLLVKNSFLSNLSNIFIFSSSIRRDFCRDYYCVLSYICFETKQSMVIKDLPIKRIF